MAADARRCSLNNEKDAFDASCFSLEKQIARQLIPNLRDFDLLDDLMRHCQIKSVLLRTQKKKILISDKVVG